MPPPSPERLALHERRHTLARTWVPAPTQALQPPRHLERTLLYRTVAEHFETWLELSSAGQFDGQGDHHTPSAYVRQAFRK